MVRAHVSYREQEKKTEANTTKWNNTNAWQTKSTPKWVQSMELLPFFSSVQVSSKSWRVPHYFFHCSKLFGKAHKTVRDCITLWPPNKECMISIVSLWNSTIQTFFSIIHSVIRVCRSLALPDILSCNWRTLTYLYPFTLWYRISSLSVQFSPLLLHNLHRDKRFPFNKNAKFIANIWSECEKSERLFSYNTIMSNCFPHQTVNYINIVYDGIKGNCNWSVAFYLPSSNWKTFFCFIVHENYVATEAVCGSCIWGDRIYSKNCPLKCKKLNFPFVCWFFVCIAHPLARPLGFDALLHLVNGVVMVMSS